MTLEAKAVAKILASEAGQLVLAESCTAGLVAAQLALVPGISSHLVGSFVTYQEHAKQRWLGIEPEMLAEHTAVSAQVTRAMAIAALDRTPQANWSAAVTGHLGPGAPPALDGVCYVAVARRGDSEIEVCELREYQLQASERADRQLEAVKRVLELIGEVLHR